MFHGIVEKNEVHDLFLFIVFGEFLIEGGFELFESSDGNIGLVESVVDSDEGSENIHGELGDVLEFFSNILGDCFLKVSSELIDIVEINHSVFENSLAFVDPEGNKLLGLASILVSL